MNVPLHMAGIDTADLAMIAAGAFSASILGGLTGYGVGLILPIFLAPAIGVANVIPAMAVATAITNASRAAAFRRDTDWPSARRILLTGLPACVAGAWLFTQLQTKWIAFALGLLLLAGVPLRRILVRVNRRIGERTVMLAGAGYGALSGGMTGTGPFLIAILMAAGVQGAALIGTDATISLAANLAKMLVFGNAARIDAELAAVGLLAGLCTVPGAYTARWLLNRIPMTLHEGMMDAIVITGALGFLWQAAT